MWRWRCKRRGKNGTYLFNEKVLAKVFRAKMLVAIEAAGIALPARYAKEWGGRTANRSAAARRH